MPGPYKEGTVGAALEQNYTRRKGERRKKDRRKTSAGAVGGATAGNPHPGHYGAKKLEK